MPDNIKPVSIKLVQTTTIGNNDTHGKTIYR
jgi:hypothetical protein